MNDTNLPDYEEEKAAAEKQSLHIKGWDNTTTPPPYPYFRSTVSGKTYSPYLELTDEYFRVSSVTLDPLRLCAEPPDQARVVDIVPHGLDLGKISQSQFVGPASHPILRVSGVYYVDPSRIEVARKYLKDLPSPCSPVDVHPREIRIWDREKRDHVSYYRIDIVMRRLLKG